MLLYLICAPDSHMYVTERRPSARGSSSLRPLSSFHIAASEFDADDRRRVEPKVSTPGDLDFESRRMNGLAPSPLDAPITSTRSLESARASACDGADATSGWMRGMVGRGVRGRVARTSAGGCGGGGCTETEGRVGRVWREGLVSGGDTVRWSCGRAGVALTLALGGGGGGGGGVRCCGLGRRDAGPPEALPALPRLGAPGDPDHMAPLPGAGRWPPLSVLVDGFHFFATDGRRYQERPGRTWLPDRELNPGLDGDSVGY